MATARKSLKDSLSNLKKRNRRDASSSPEEDEGSQSEDAIDEPDFRKTPNIEKTTERLNYLNSKRERDKKTHKLIKPKITYPDLHEFSEDQPIKQVERKGYGYGPGPAIAITIFFIVIVIVIFSVRLIPMQYLQPNKISEKPLSQVYNEMKMNVKMLKQKTHQSHHFWIQILSQFKKLTEMAPLQPATLLAVVPRDSQRTAACLSQQILDIVKSAFNDKKYISFDVESHMTRNATALKHDLDESLQNLSQFHAAGIYNLEKLAPEATMIFHAYCDTDNAPHKRALFLMTMGINLDFASMLMDTLDATIYHYLTDLWSGGLREDDSAAIISRLANAPIVFAPERTDIINSLCPI